MVQTVHCRVSKCKLLTLLSLCKALIASIMLFREHLDWTKSRKCSTHSYQATMLKTGMKSSLIHIGNIPLIDLKQIPFSSVRGEGLF